MPHGAGLRSSRPAGAGSAWAPRTPRRRRRGSPALLNQQALFQKLGRLSAGDPLPFIGSVAQVKGAGDTVLVILGLSLENRALSFQKDGTAYVAKYRVDATLPAGDRPRR